MKTYKASDWGGNTLEACRDVFRAKDDGADIIVHVGHFEATSDHHLSTISNACVDTGIELVVRGTSDPGVVYPHITFVEQP